MTSSTIYHRDYYKKHKKKIQEYARNYRKNNIYYKLYYLNNRQKLLDYGKAYYNAHRDHCRKLNIAWKLKNIPGYRKTKKQPITFKKINQPTIVTFN